MLRRTFPPDDTPISLSNERVLVHASGHPVAPALAATSLHLRPSTRVEVAMQAQAPFSGLANVAQQLDAVEIEYPARGTTGRGHVWSFSIGPTITADAILESLETGRASKVAAVSFALANFRDLRRSLGGSRGSALVFGDGQWEMTLLQEPDIRQRLDALRGRGGILITHQGEIRRRDGLPMLVTDAEQVLDALHFFLSFVRGAWTGPLLPLGHDDQGSVHWELWEAPRTDQWVGAQTWVDRHHGEVLDDVFPGFHARWQTPDWNEPLRRLVNWYVSALQGAGSIEGATVLAQTALELLAWQILVVDPGGGLSKQQFKGIGGAADRIRYMLEHAGIPDGFPPQLTHLPRSAGGAQLWDGPAALVEIRNNIAHPERQGAALLGTPEAHVEAWELSLWYLELLLLYVCEFQGHYSNRFAGRWVGHVEPVPWAAAEAPRQTGL